MSSQDDSSQTSGSSSSTSSSSTSDSSPSRGVERNRYQEGARHRRDDMDRHGNGRKTEVDSYDRRPSPTRPQARNVEVAKDERWSRHARERDLSSPHKREYSPHRTRESDQRYSRRGASDRQGVKSRGRGRSHSPSGSLPRHHSGRFHDRGSRGYHERRASPSRHYDDGHGKERLRERDSRHYRGGDERRHRCSDEHPKSDEEDKRGDAPPHHGSAPPRPPVDLPPPPPLPEPKELPEDLPPHKRIKTTDEPQHHEEEGGSAGNAEGSPHKNGPQPNMNLSGKLAAETNTVNGVVLKYTVPPEARKPTQRWRLYVFKGGDIVGEPLYIHRMDHFLFGRERKVADVPLDHPSCSGQHALLCYRLTEKVDEFGVVQRAVRPYLMDLESTNGTYINGERVEASRFYELLEKDMIKFGYSSREYVLLHEKSAGA